MTILGVMGEAPKLTAEESVTFLSRVLDRVAGRAGVIVGVSNPGLDNLARLAHKAMEKGAGGVMVAPLAGLNTEVKVLGYYERSEERRVGKECGSTCRFRWSPDL